MAGVLAAATTSNSAGTAGTASDAINNLDLSTFLTLMIKELQNQDPLNPLDNKDMLAQLSQIRSVGATDKLTKTLDSVLLGQNIASATNMIGADVTGLTDAGESFNGIVTSVAIDKGVPKLHVENLPSVVPSGTEGNIDAGTYAYHVVWDDAQGNLFGMDFSGNKAITTTGTAGVDRAIQIGNLPVTDGPKYVYRTDASGTGPYQLVGVIADGNRGSFLDVTSDADRDGSVLTQSFQSVATTSRAYAVGLSNVGTIRPPSF
jgi:flagellar basal-body rod modification protein FlgD